MATPEQFYTLKAQMIKVFTAYIEGIEKCSYEDLQELMKRLTLLDNYIEAVKTNTEFWQLFIRKENVAQSNAG